MNLVRCLQEAGYEVAVAAPPGRERSALEARGIRFYPIALNPSGTSPFEDAVLFAKYCFLLRRIRPLAFLGFTAKPNIYGSLAASFCRIPVINNLTGLGTAFIGGTGLERLVSSLYRLALRNSEAVFFHNPDDLELFVSRRLVARERAAVLPGSGIDLERFTVAAYPSAAGPTFLFVGRLLSEKGVREFAAAARLVRQKAPDARFQLLGSFDGGPRAVTEAEVEQWEREGAIAYLGTCTDVRPFIANADCVVLPSYREGLPRVLLEAAAMGRPVVATDVPGCRHVVVDGVTGYLCDARSSESLAQAMLRMSRLGPAEREAMGLRGRIRAEEHFGEERVCSAYVSVMSRVSARHGRA